MVVSGEMLPFVVFAMEKQLQVAEEASKNKGAEKHIREK